ncbi:hypothetical protein BX070DRAFT_237251 [Coemansia spiralis]|nr:hypothetical protein BX070DRAFT_237251 [Coemansia spiralis]
MIEPPLPSNKSLIKDTCEENEHEADKLSKGEPCTADSKQAKTNEILTTQKIDSKRATGLSTAIAKNKLLELLDTDHTRVLIPPHFDQQSKSLRAILGATAIIVVFLLVNGAYVLAKGDPDQTRGIGSVVEAALLLLSIAFTYWAILRESKLETRELDMRLCAISQEIRGWNGIYADLRTPQLPTVTTYTTLRDGVWRDVPTLLLVEGDIIALAYGESTPCNISLRTGNDDLARDTEFTLSRGQKFTPEIMQLWQPAACLPNGGVNSASASAQSSWDPREAGHSAMAGRVLFLVKATPLNNHLTQISLHHQRTGRSVLQNQIRVVIRLCALRILPFFFIAALIANAVIYGVVSAKQQSHYSMGVEAILGKTVYIVFPFACTVLWPVFWIISRIFTNSCEVVLFDTLQRSKTDYEDTDNIDEFDIEALPPTKDITVGIGAIVDHMRWLWFNCDYRTLSRSSNLSETLGNITVICGIDKEGTIAEPFCTPEQIVVPDQGDDYAILDVAQQQEGAEMRTFIIDEGWEKYLPSLRPLGLDCSLNTSAHRLGGGRTETTHRRHNQMRRHGKVIPAQDTCLCRIGKAIGFIDEDLSCYSKLKEVNVFAPFHEATVSLTRKDVFCAASFTSTIIQTDGSPGLLQMLTDGNVELVLGMCLDYFDGTDIKPLDDHTIAQYYSLYLNALQQDLQCLAFSYRPLTVDIDSIKWPGWKKSEAASDNRPAKRSNFVKATANPNVQSLLSKYVDLHLDDDAVQSAITEYNPTMSRSSAESKSTDNKEIAQNSVLSATMPVENRTGTYNKSLGKPNGDIADIADAETVTPFAHTAAGDVEEGIGNDLSANGLAANSMNSASIGDGKSQTAQAVISSARDGYNFSDDDSDEVATHSSSLDDLPDYLTEAARKALLRSKTKFTMQSNVSDNTLGLDYNKESLCQLSEEEDLLRDAVTEQIFLGLATFAYEPKTDVCDFIEDLDIAGIRFVYFSRATGRQSKAFAERLGLETDWNTCILLSSGTDGIQGDGYIEDHDIKARLPRGIENIRSHLKEVDDIPLQISLFAECTPESTREMIKIFQDYGDVVCCIGSALKDSNTLTFAATDLAVGIEPIPHFNRVFYGGAQGITAPVSQSTTRLSSNDDPAAAEVAEASAVALRSAVLSGHDATNDGSISTSGALVTQYALGAALTCIPCPLFLQHDTSLYMLMQVISEARRLVSCVQQAAILLLCSCLVLVAINFVTALCLLPPALTGYMLLWILWIVVPLLGITLLFTPHDENIMSTMPLKNHSHVSDISRFAIYVVIRMLPPIVITVFVYVITLARLLDDSPKLGQISSVFGRKDWMSLSSNNQWALLGAQTYAMTAFVFHCVCISSTLMYRTRSWIEFVPFRNVAWIFGSVVSLLLTFVFSALLLVFGDASVSRAPWYTYVIAFAGPVVLLPLQELCKLHDKKRWTRLQKLAKLEFKTKLGLHSPL